ncbi:dof zinc finger protein DOF1.6-like [Panicum miliaceum]|uniref:Dof zinc finger protein DOF1.6-like n=1 Tax=Panicum miliaceum TaxID=4540 RepID=A0A3L6SPQ9_PANMI|nr:dof zinc finger protein DOF1.6-like [Panicum miliaceum]
MANHPDADAAVFKLFGKVIQPPDAHRAAEEGAPPPQPQQPLTTTAAAAVLQPPQPQSPPLPPPPLQPQAAGAGAGSTFDTFSRILLVAKRMRLASCDRES